jgi:hypothetical protein
VELPAPALVPGPAAEAVRGEGAPASPTPPRFWARAEYLLWWIKDSHYPPLVTTGAATDPLPGALGMPGTQVLFGGRVDNEERSGGRFTAGLRLDDAGTWGLEAGYFFLGTRSAGAADSSPGTAGSAVLARPFVDVLAGREDASLVAYPGLASGTVTVHAPSFLQGADANLACLMMDKSWLRVEALAGFRYLNLQEDLDIGEDVQVSAGAPVFAGDTIVVGDHFDARNNFYGGQLGLRASACHGRWDLDVAAKVALGDTHEVVTIAGSTTIAPAAGPARVLDGGLLALPTNSGRFGRDAFAVVPEVEVTLGYHVTRWLRAYVGYTFIYWSDVVRPGDQIDRTVNRHEVPTSRLAGPLTGPARPAFSFAETDFWAQGLTLGLELRY